MQDWVSLPRGARMVRKPYSSDVTASAPVGQPLPYASWVVRGLLLVPLVLAVLLLHGLQCGSAGAHDPLAAAAVTFAHHAPAEQLEEHAAEKLDHLAVGSTPVGPLGAISSPGPPEDPHGPGHLMQVCFALLVGGVALAGLVARSVATSGARRPRGSVRDPARRRARRIAGRPPDLLQLCVSRT